MAESRVRERHDLITVERAAKMAGASRPLIIRRILDGTLGAERINQWYFVFRADVEAFAKSRAAAALRKQLPDITNNEAASGG